MRQEEAVEELVGVAHLLLHRVAIFQGLLRLNCRLVSIECLIARFCHRWMVRLGIAAFFSTWWVERIQRLSGQARYLLLALHGLKMLDRLVDTPEKG